MKNKKSEMKKLKKIHEPRTKRKIQRRFTKKEK